MRITLRPIVSGLLIAVGGACTTCTRPGTSGGDVNMKVPALLLDISDGPVLAAAHTDIFPDFELTDPEILTSPVIFANTRNDDQNIYIPTLLRDQGQVWKQLQIPTLDHTEWVYAGAAIERNELWALLDSASPTRGPGLYFLRSTDGGNIWTLFSAIRPPSILAEFTSFTINPDGKGVCTVHQDDDTQAAPRGIYAYQTADGGHTWTGPAFTPDDLVSADPPAFPTLADTLKDADPMSSIPAPPPVAPQRPTPNFRPFNNRSPQLRPQNNGRGRRG